jgi:hypothetical protein
MKASRRNPQVYMIRDFSAGKCILAWNKKEVTRILRERNLSATQCRSMDARDFRSCGDPYGWDVSTFWTLSDPINQP